MNDSPSASQVNATQNNRLPDLRQRSELLLNSFDGAIEPVKTSAGYRIGILVVTVVMLLLPLIYIGLICLVGYGVYWHTTHNLGILDNELRGKAKIGPVLLYATPIVTGAFLCLFMLKPLFASRGGAQNTRALNEKDEPLLFAFVRKICDAVRAPHPKSIEVDSNVNASASFRRGAWSMLTGNDLTLTIGTPLVAGLNSRQFAGVLAHEFGHFSQGAGMRLTYVIRTISYWLARAVYERDKWDETLVSWSNGIDFRIGWIFYVTRLFVWLTRKILWCLMTVGNAVSGYMLRQMEFDADRHETRLAGNRTFEATARQLAVLNFANQGAQSDLANFYREGRLGNDLALLVRANADRFDGSAIKKINAVIDEQTTGVFDTHPCDTERIASSNSEPTEGIFRLELPAEAVFTDFAGLSQAVTLDFYSEIFGESFDASKLHDITDLLARQKEETAAFESAHRYFQGASSPTRPQSFKIGKPEEAEKIRKMILVGRKRLAPMLEGYGSQLKQLDSVDDLDFEISHATNFLEAGYKVGKDSFSRPLCKSAEIDGARGEVGQTQMKLHTAMEPVEKLNRQRFAIAMSLLGSSEVKSKLDNFAELRNTTRQLLPLHNKISTLKPQLDTLGKEAAFVSILLSQFQESDPDEKAINHLKFLLENLRNRSFGIRKEFESVDYPFDHATSDISVGAFLFDTNPDSEDIGGILDAASNVASELPRLQFRILGQLCLVAEQLEAAIGVEVLPEPPETS